MRRVYALFFLSGAAGLAYEVVWSRLFKEVFGVTAHAVAAVLATYLGGLALGSWALGRAADRSANPLRLYGVLEIGVGLSALAGTLLIRFFDPLHMQAASRLAPDSAALACVRLLLAAAVILPPTFLMGGTLPAVSKFFVGGLGRLGRELGFLYALNTAGAVAGSLAAGFILIRSLGVHPTLWLAAAVNLAVGAVSLALTAQSVNSVNSSREAQLTAFTESAEPAPGEASWLLLAAGLGGVASLALEVIWTRVLVLIVGGSTHAFVTMLAAFLVGIALGSLVARLFADRIESPRRAFGWVQAGIAASTLASVPLLGSLVAAAQRWLLSMELHWLAVTLLRFGISFLVLLLPATLIGMSFPLAAKIRVQGVRTLGGELGKVYGAVALGNIVGALLGGFVLLPALGMQRAVVLVTGLNLAGAIWGFWPSHGHRLLRAAPALALAVVSAALLALWKPRPFASVEEGESDRVLFYDEGLVSTVKVIQRADDARQLVMLVDGVRIGQSSGGIDYKQQALAHFPFLLAQGVRRVLSIGLGTGILAGEVARHPGVESVDCVELSPSVIAGARFFRDFNGDALGNPLVHVISDDGINFLKRSAARYDAVISDGKSRLGEAGNAPFYSDDHFRSARDHLSPSGVMIQWMPLEEVAEDLRTIVRTFMKVFPHAYLFIGQGSFFLAGLQQPLAPDLARVQRILDAPESDHLRRYGWTSAADVAALLVADNSSAKDWLSHEETDNSLEKPVLEFYSLRALAAPAAERIAANSAALAAVRTGVRPVAQSPDVEAGSRALAYLMDAWTVLGSAEPSVAGALLQRAVSEAPRSGAIRYAASATLVALGFDFDRRGDRAKAIPLYRAAVDAWPDSVTARLDLGGALAEEGSMLEAVEQAQKAIELNPDSGAARRLLARLIEDLNPRGAVEQLREAVRIAPEMAEVHVDLARNLMKAGRPDEALAEFREAMRLSPGLAAEGQRALDLYQREASVK